MPGQSILPGRRWNAVGVAVVSVVDFLLGFPLGVYLEEWRRRGWHASAWRSTREALRAMDLSIRSSCRPRCSPGAWRRVLF